MQKKQIAVIGSKQQTLMFNSINAEILQTQDVESSVSFIKKCTGENIKYIFVSDDLLEKISNKYDLIKLAKESVVSAIPSEKGSSIYIKNYINDLLHKAVGININGDK